MRGDQEDQIRLAREKAQCMPVALQALVRDATNSRDQQRQSTGVEFGGATMSKRDDQNQSDDSGEDSIVYLTTLPNEPLAQMWAETLRRNGIKVLVKPLGPGFGAWGSTFSFDHELHVHASDHDEAMSIVQDLTDAEADEVPAE